MFIRNLKSEEVELIRRVEMFVRDSGEKKGDRDPSRVFEVVRLAVEIARRLPHPVHPLIVVLTALFHDLGNRLIGEHSVASFVGASVAESFLRVAGVSDLERMQIVRAVAMSGISGVMNPETIEERIVSDAWRLDRMSMVGLIHGLMGSGKPDEEFFAERIAQTKADFDSLYFDESRTIGEPLYNQSRILSESLEKVFRMRPAGIDQIILPQG
jgi:uncharacterized protein